MKRILVPIGCRSDEGLSTPVIKRLREHFSVVPFPLSPQNFSDSYLLTEMRIKQWSPNLILITGDRVEMCAAAAAAFHNRIKIAHFYAGVVKDPITTFDDVDRHCITLWSDIQFCESKEAAKVAFALKMGGHQYVVGISHLDDLEVDESKVPKSVHNGIDPINYDLSLINYQPLGNPPFSFNKERHLIQIGGNPDGEILKSPQSDEFYPSLPRPQFLGLLKNCQRFITNSSAAIYEAPHFLKPEQIVMVGDRNKNRPRGPFQTGASDRIVEILREYLK